MVEIEGQRSTIALAAGGTGGHMFPAEALAEEMRARGWKIVLFTDARGMRYGETFPADEIIQLDAANPSAPGPAAKAKAALAMAGGLVTALQGFRRHKPHVAVGFGGYPSAPAMVAARIMKTPHGVHEQNAVLGRVNRMVAPKADFVAHGFPKLERLPSTKATVMQTGNPVRAAIRAVEGAAYDLPQSGPIRVLVFGGSQGASLFSRVVPKALAALPADLRGRISVTQQVYEHEQEEVKAVYDKAGIACELAPFFRDMPDRFTAAHLVIARSGASSVTEIATVGRPAILVPLGIAMDDHQTGNAEVLVEAGGARRIAEPDFTPETLGAALGEVLPDASGLARMAAAAAQCAPHDAVARLADHVETLAR